MTEFKIIMNRFQLSPDYAMTLNISFLTSYFFTFTKIIAATINTATKTARTIPTIPPVDNTPLRVVSGGSKTLRVMSDMVALPGKRGSVKA